MNEKFEGRRYFEDYDISSVEKHLKMSIPNQAFQNQEFVELLDEFIRMTKTYESILSKGNKDEIVRAEKEMVKMENELIKELKKIPNTRPELN